jgi:hypothetical protein
MRAVTGMTLPMEGSKLEKGGSLTGRELDILCVDDRILLTEEDVVGSVQVVGSAGAGAASGAGGSAGSSGSESVYHVVELVAHASVGPDTRDSSVLPVGHVPVQRMAADLALTSGALKVDSTRVAGWIVNYELADREEDVALLEAGLHVLHVFHDGPTVTRVVYWGPDSSQYVDLDLEEGE